MLIPQLPKTHSDLIHKPRFELKDCLGLEQPDRKYYDRRWDTGCELQSVTSGVEWDTTTGSPTIDTTTKRSGAASLRCNPSAATAFIRHQYSASNPTANFYARFYLYIATSTNALDDIFALYDAGEFSNSLSIRLNSNRTLELWDWDFIANAQLGSDSSALDLNTWYRIEVSVVGTTATAYI